MKVDVGGSAKVIGHAQLRLNPTEPKEPVLERSLSPVSRGRVEAGDRWEMMQSMAWMLGWEACGLPMTSHNTYITHI